MTKDTPVIEHRGERILAFMTASAVILSILCILAVIVATLLGVRNFNSPPWPTVFFLPAIGLPIGLIMMIILLIVSARRRGREAKDARK
ncbi:MAG: hypothetical protein EPN91_06350 [Salinibacterium sp.]|nr:MAG: hypothetical protein EPN91_06350 [Salinibacterium sp.]